MQQLLKWIKNRFQTFDLLGEYFLAIKNTGWDLLWGASLISMAYCLSWFRTTPPPLWITIMYLIGLVFVSGYYLWRHDHVRLMPKLEVTKFHIRPYLGTVDPKWKQVVLIQVTPDCLTESPVQSCLAQLVNSYKRSNGKEWIHTELEEPWTLAWSGYQGAPMPIEPRVGQRLNVCWIDNAHKRIIPCLTTNLDPGLSMRMDANEFRMDVHISATDCAALDFSVLIKVQEEWDKPIVELCN